MSVKTSPLNEFSGTAGRVCVSQDSECVCVCEQERVRESGKEKWGKGVAHKTDDLGTLLVMIKIFLVAPCDRKAFLRESKDSLSSSAFAQELASGITP